MLLSIRRSVFETNSSSTHSIVFMTADEYEKFNYGDLFVDTFTGKLVTFDEAKTIIKEKIKNEKRKPRDYEALVLSMTAEEFRRSTGDWFSDSTSFLGERFLWGCSRSIDSVKKKKRKEPDGRFKIDIDHFFG